jgi:uncharacterized protein YjiS (DUF1127 family)
MDRIACCPHAPPATMPPADAHRRAVLRVAGLPLRIAAQVAGLLRIWRRRAVEGDELRRMSDRELRDLGISRYEAGLEARKPFWRG